MANFRGYNSLTSGSNRMINAPLAWRIPFFSVFGATENNSQTENIFGLTKKASLVLKNGFRF